MELLIDWASQESLPELLPRGLYLPSVPWTNLYEDTLQRIRTESRDILWKIEDLPSDIRSPGLERIRVDGRDGFRVHNDYLNKEGAVILSAERVGCWPNSAVGRLIPKKPTLR